MVFESIVAEVLNKTLGQYIQNFDSDKLKLGLWGGDVVLNDLQLKPTALDDLNLPIRCSYGYLGQLVLKIPWKDIYNSPCVAVIDKLYLLAVPNQHARYDEKLEAKFAKEAKQAELNRVEEAKKKELEKDLPKGSPASKTFTEKIVATVIKNIQVTIKNIHIRYEDRISNPGSPFALGITLSSLEVKTTAAWGEPLKIDPLNLIYKELTVNYLAAYWNSNEKMFSLQFLVETALLRNAMQAGIGSSQNNMNYKYIIGPINAKASLRINTKPEEDGTDFSVPKFLLNLELEKLYARISKRQYQDVTCFLDSLDTMAKAAMYRKYRPTVTTYKGNPKEWWLFAYNAIVEEQIRRRKREWDWNHIKNYRKLMKDYSEVYKQKLLTTKPSKDVLDRCEELEDQLDVLVIVVVRQIVESEISKEQLLIAKGLKEEQKSGWMSRWFGGAQKPDEGVDLSNLREKFSAALTPDEREKMFRAIGYSEGETAIYPEKFIETDVGATIHAITVEFIDEKLQHPSVMTISLDKVSAAFEQRPAIKGIKTTVSILQFTVHGVVQDNKAPKLVSSEDAVAKSTPLLQVLFEINPLDRKVDQRINVSAEPLSIIYDAKTINSLSDIFKAEMEIPSAITLAAQEKLDEFKQVSSLGLQHMLETRTTLEISVNIQASRVLIPYGGYYVIGNSVIVINLGSITVNTQPRKPFIAKQVAGKEAQREMMIESSYDNFVLKLANLQVVYAMKGEKWVAPKPDMYFLKPTTLEIQLGKCIITNDPSLPKLKVKGKLPVVEISFTEMRLKDCMSLIMSIPFTPKDESKDTLRSTLRAPSMRSLRQSMLHLEKIQTAASTAALTANDSQIAEDVAQFFDMECTFELQELLLVLFNNPTGEEIKKFLQFRLNHLMSSFNKYSFNSTVSLQLGSVLLQHNFDESWIDMVSTPRIETKPASNYLVKFNYTSVDKNSPEFHTKYKSTLSLIDIDFTKLELLLHCEALRALIAWSDEMQKILAPVEERVSDAADSLKDSRFRKSASQLLGTIAEELGGSRASLSKRAIRPAGKPLRVDHVVMQLDAKLGEIAVSLWKEKEKFASIGIAGGSGLLTVKKSYTMFTVTLSGVYLNNHFPGTCYPKILTTKDQQEVLTMKVVSFSNPDRRVGSVDLSVNLSMSCLQFVYLNGFVMAILDFLNKFSTAREKLIDASQAAAEAAKQNVQNVYENAIRIELDIDLKAPYIIVPVNKKTLEAFTLNMGHITAKNTFLDIKVPNASDPAVLDRLKVNLENLTFSRVLFNETVDKVLKENPIIEPISLKLTIQRNLSTGWFLDLPDLEIGGKFHTIKLTLTPADYYMLMKALEENVADPGPVDTSPRAKKSVATPSKAKISSTTAQLQPAKKQVILPSIHEKSVRSTLKFALTLESLVVEMISMPDIKNVKNLEDLKKEGLARVTLELISLKGSMMSDDSMHVSLILLDSIIDDIRPSRTDKINRYMERKKDPSGDGDRPRSMLDVTFQQNPTARFVDVRISSFVLLLNVEHLEKISKFFSDVPEIEGSHDIKSEPVKHSAVEPAKKAAPGAEPAYFEPEKMKLTLNFKCEHPDIVLVEHLDSLDSNAIVLDFEMVASVRNADEKMLIHGSVNDLQLFSCAYNPEKRKETKSPILNPVTVLLCGYQEGNNLKVDLDSTRIKISVTPGIISLLSSIATTLTAGHDASETQVEDFIDRTNMWEIQDFHETSYTFLQTELAVEALELAKPTERKSAVKELKEAQVEICGIKFPEVIICLETGQGRTTMPVLYIDTSLEVTASNWSSKLHLEGKLMFGMKYFNNRHAVWEPIIEPVPVVENTNLGYYNWALQFMMEKNVEEDSDTSSVSITSEEGKSKKPLFSIAVTSGDTLNITLTRKSLDIVSALGQMISDAIYKPEAYSGEKAPYIVRNDTGIAIKVLLDKEYVVYPPSSAEGTIKDILLDVDSSVGLSSCTEIEYLGIAEESKEKFIHIVIPTHNCDIRIPVMKAAKRFFRLNHPSHSEWGIVSDVIAKNGQTVVTLRGIIQVKNSFNLPISIYSMTNKENELHLIGVVDPQDSINVPIDAIYTLTNELFFSVEGYTVSIVPYVWKDLINCVSKSKILRCNPKGENEQAKGLPLFLRAIGEYEQVYYENSNRHNLLSACFNISIQPTVTFKNTLPVDIVVCMEGITDPTQLAPAASTQVPTAEPGISYLVIQIPNYLDREWSSKNLLEDEPNELSVWTFESFESSPGMKMELGVHVEVVHGTHQYTLYCPFWMVNKTGLQLAYKQNEESGSVLYHPPDYNGIIMFSFKAKAFFAKKKSSVRVEDGHWSDKFSLDTAGNSGVIICKTKTTTYHIGVQIRIMSNPLSKEVLFTPFHVFTNNHPCPIEIREVGKDISPWITVGPGDCVPFWPYSKPDTGKLEARVGDTQESTLPFPYSIAHNSVLKLNNKYGALNVDIHISEGGVFISFYAYEPGMAPVLLINHTHHVIDVCDKAAKESTGVDLKPRQQALFTWGTFDEHHFLSFAKGKYNSDLKEDTIGSFTLGNEELYWSTFLYGLQRIFLFTDSRSIAAESVNLVDYEQVSQEMDIRVHGVGLSLVDDEKKAEILYISLSGSDVVWESRKAGKRQYKRFSDRDSQVIEAAYQDYIEAQAYVLDPPAVKTVGRFTMDFKQMKLLAPTEKNIRRTYVEGVWANIKTSPHLSRIHLKVNRLQIDQQIWDCIFPVVFAPVPPPKSVMAEHTPKPFIEVSILKMRNQYSHVEQFKYFGILIQEFHIRVDTGLLTNVIGMFEEKSISQDMEIKIIEGDIKRASEQLSYFVSCTRGQEVKNYYGKLHLSPLKMHLSFSLSSGESSEDEKNGLPPIVNLFLRSFGVTLTDLNDVVFKINYFQRECILVTQTQLLKEVQNHYTTQVLHQLYVLVFGLDVIGNPYGLFLGFTQGATDLFYEPFQGAIRGPGEFAEGLVLGVRSLFGHTVGGAAGAISKMTGAMGKGLAALTFDDDYQRQRREHQRMRPANMQEGLARSGKGLVMGVVEGVGGVVMKPISGAKEEGFAGFFKGVGKGMVGLVTRPTAGIVDFASGSLGAVRRATEISQEVTRHRVPRYIRPDGVIRPYSPREAEGNKYLQELDKGKYAKTDEYIFHMNIGYASKNKDVLLLTDNRIIYLGYNEIFGGYQLEWVHKWADIVKTPEVTKEGVRFWTEKQKSLKSLFSSSDNGKILLVDDPTIRKKLADLMIEQMSKEIQPIMTPSKSSLRSSGKCEQLASPK